MPGGMQGSYGGMGGYGAYGMGGDGDPRTALAMQLVQMFQGSPDPYHAAGTYVSELGSMYRPQQGAMYAGVGGYKKPRMGVPQVGEKGNWGCSDCGNVNFSFRAECNKCKKAKDVTA